MNGSIMGIMKYGVSIYKKELKKGGDNMRIKVKFGDTGFGMKLTFKQWIRYLIYK